MPVELLTDEQAGAYGSFREVSTRPELERFFFLDTDDLDLVALRRTDGHRLGMALQICTARYVGLFLEDPLDVPWPVVEYLARQLGINDPSCVKQYVERPKTAYEHSWEIRRRFGYHEFEDPQRARKFRTFLYGRAWTYPEGPVALFNHAVAWLRRNRVLLPGASVLARQVSEARAVAERRCTPRWPEPCGGLIPVCRRRWCRCSMCRREHGFPSWSGCAALPRARRARRWPVRWSGSRRSRRFGWGG